VDELTVFAESPPAGVGGFAVLETLPRDYPLRGAVPAEKEWLGPQTFNLK
jgi:hypothetical protein